MENSDTSIFRKDSILDSDCERFSFRIDFYSMPDFLEKFTAIWKKDLLGHDLNYVEFNVNKLNLIQRHLVNVDAVSEALNTPIEQILAADTIVFPNLFSKDGTELKENQRIIVLINKYFIQLTVIKVNIDDFIHLLCEMLYIIIVRLWMENSVSVVDIQINAEARKMFGKDFYATDQSFGGYLPVNNGQLHNQVSTFQFVEDNLKCIVTNFLSLTDVFFENDVKEIMWEQKLSADCVLTVEDKLKADGFRPVFDFMISKAQDYIKLCAR